MHLFFLTAVQTQSHHTSIHASPSSSRKTEQRVLALPGQIQYAGNPVTNHQEIKSTRSQLGLMPVTSMAVMISML